MQVSPVAQVRKRRGLADTAETCPGTPGDTEGKVASRGRQGHLPRSGMSPVVSR